MKHEADGLVRDALSGVMPILALRGTDEYAREGGDLDYIAPPGRAVEACLAVSRAGLEHGWFVIGFRDIGYLAQVVLVRPQVGGNDDAVKIDIFDGLRWYGVGRDVSYRLFDMQVSAIDARLASAAGFFQKILIVGKASERDWLRAEAMGASASYLADMATMLGLPINRAQIDARGVEGLSKWRLRAASGGGNGFPAILFWFLRATYAHLKFKLGIGTKSGLVLGISGMDGSGKSTVIDRLMSAYRKAGGIRPGLVHLLPSWIPLPHQLMRRRKTASNYTRPYSEPPVSSRVNGGVRLAYYLFAFMLAKASLWLSTKQGRQIILDRSIVDFVSDLTRARIPAWRLPSWLVRFLTPSGLLFYLDASPSIVVSRKGELALEKARGLQASYRKACTAVGAIMLAGDDPPEVVYRALLEGLAQEYLQRIENRCLKRCQVVDG